MRHSASFTGDFKCAHCHSLVSSAHFLSGVNNRNHCPYCLWSRHLDLFASGDRLSACKGQMKPIGLAMKPGRNKYRLDQRGELMLVHQCLECRSLSINRIAADDHAATLMDVFQASLKLDDQIPIACREDGITILNEEYMETVYIQLYGQVLKVPALGWS